MISRVFRTAAARGVVASRFQLARKGAVSGFQPERYGMQQKVSFSAQTTGMWRGAPNLNVDKALNIVETINMYLESSNALVRLQEINEQKDVALSVRWQSMLDVYFGVSLHVIVPFGFTGDQLGLQTYTMEIGQALQGMEDTPEIKELQELSSESWTLLLNNAFGVDLGEKSIPVDQLRAMAKEISQNMQNPEFLREVENNVKPLDIEKKQPALMAALVPLQMKTTEAYGMPGEEGYVLLQAEMMKNMADPEIQHNMAAAMQAILRTADIPTGM